MTHFNPRKRSIRRGLLVAGTIGLLAIVALWFALQPPAFHKKVGIPLPPSVTNFHSAIQRGFDGDEYWASAKVSRQDFEKMVVQLKATQDPAKLNYYCSGNGFETFGRTDISPWWCKDFTVNADTYIVPGTNSFILVKYEDGRFFLRYSTY